MIVQFSQLEHAKAAPSVNEKLKIADRFHKISFVTDHIGAQDTAAKSTDLDDDEGGLALIAQSQAMLMEKLDRTGTATSKPVAVTMPILPQQVISAASETVGSPTECLLPKNLFDPATEVVSSGLLISYMLISGLTAYLKNIQVLNLKLQYVVGV
ncbi:hypothetical protein SAY87_016429 [Trapa incisa]|uniref:Splicing factor RBM39 linker domain-containing protein n=1 Tax=Trapa incisa TaxID=236973 RepID=A0AAN7LCG2_9MYRT|nr:hypothetical protein SAY87_016429 [Trapa incisa]